MRLAHIISAADSKTLGETLCAEVDGITFLLQPLVDIPLLVKVQAAGLQPSIMSLQWHRHHSG